MKMRKLIALLMVLAALVCLCSFEGQAAFKVDNQWSYTTPLTDAEMSDLSALAAEETAKVGDTDFLVVFAADWTSDAETELRRNGYSSAKQNVIGLVIWYNGAKYETDIGTWGDLSRYISADAIQTLKSEVDADAKAGRMYEAARTLIVRSAEMMSAGKLENPPKTRGQKVLSSLLFGLVFGVVGGGIAVLIVVLKYRKKNRSASYPLEQFANLTLTLERENFLYHTVTKVPISTGSSSSGGGSSGGSSGGGFRSSGRS